MNIFKALAFVSALTFGLLTNPLQTIQNGQLTLPIALAGDCTQVQSQRTCNRSTNGRTWHGEGVISKPIEVEVCNGYWNQLDVGTYRGTKTKWYSPVMQYGNWYGDFEVVVSPCKKYWVRPGTIIKVFASCVDRIISTGPMKRPGRYLMK